MHQTLHQTPADTPGFLHAAPLLKALQEDPPAYVPNKDLMAFDETLDGLLDHLHEVMFTTRGPAR